MSPRGKKILEQDEAYDHPDTYRVFVEDEFKFGYDPTIFTSLGDVIEDLLGHLATLQSDGFEEWDLAVWQECRLAAVILTGPGRDPVVHVLADLQNRRR